jgi:HK97 family phage major capsid protein
VIHIHEARRRKAELRAQMADLHRTAGDKALTSVQQKQWNEANAEICDLESKIAKHEAGSMAEAGPQPVINVERSFMHSDAVRRVAGNNLRELYARATPDERAQIDGLAATLSGRVNASADLRPSADGGVVIPTFITDTLERNYSAFAPVVSVARIWGTDTGADQVFPVLSDSEVAEQLDAAAATGADATVSGDTPPTALTGPTLKAYKISSKPVFINREIFTDSPVNIIEEIVGALLARIIRLENARFTKGTGSGQAEGFLTNATAYTIAHGSALDLDVCLDLAYNVPALYRPQGAYMMSDTTAKYLRKLKTGIASDKRQLWADADATKGTPATLHGYGVVINNDMDDVAADGTFASKNPVAFGAFGKFVVRQAENNQPYAYRYSVPAKDGSAVILFRRSDSKLLVSSAISKLAVAAG